MSVALVLGALTSCGLQGTPERTYNEGINIIPMPAAMQVQDSCFHLTPQTKFYASTPEARTVAEFFASKLKLSTGFDLAVGDTESESGISLLVDPDMDINVEGYHLEVTPQGVLVKAKTPQGIFYGMQTLMQLLPAEVESPRKVSDIDWSAQCVTIDDGPRFAYRGVMLDPCRHFIPVENVKKQLDVLSLFKINTMHLHLTDDQGWRIEIKKYPRLTEVGARRIEGEGYEYGGFYTQEDIKDIVAYAAERFITVIPELELPGHEMAAIAAYPELSCKGDSVVPRILWGVEDVVMCPGKEDMFTFLEDVVSEMAPLFPGTYFHIGGDECPKGSWKNCPLCQKRIKDEGLVANEHSPEERLQSYVIQRMEKVLAKYGKRIIGWDEILEGGLSPQATVMSWRGEQGGIASAMQNHDVIMTPSSNGMYFDQYQGDSRIEPVTIGGYTLLSRVYNYNPVPDTLVTMGKAHHIKGVQANCWSEYMYNTDLMEYRMYPRVMALAEIAWTPVERKNYEDFERRINNAYVRLDGHGINYHIPQPEQPGGSCNFVAFTDSATLTFTTTRPETMVYTLDGKEPTPASTVYSEPIVIKETTALKIRTVLPSGKMSPTRVITVEKQNYAPAVAAGNFAHGLQMRMTPGTFFEASELDKATEWKELVIEGVSGLRGQMFDPEKGYEPYGAIATGYLEIPEDGVYYFSTNNDEVWIDGKRIIDNKGQVKRFPRTDASIALAKGLHELKVVFLRHIIGGWPSWWDGAHVNMRKADEAKYSAIRNEQLFH